MNWVWTFWIAGIVASFMAFEGYALSHGKTTLSRYTWDLTKAWPPLPLLVGFGMGFVTCHFWWGGSLICY
jgi:hypothetical protein